MNGIGELLSLPWYVELIVAMIVLFWMARDITKQGMGAKYRWPWTIAVVAVYYFLSLIGVAIVILVYIIWSRAFYSKR